MRELKCERVAHARFNLAGVRRFPATEPARLTAIAFVRPSVRRTLLLLIGKLQFCAACCYEREVCFSLALFALYPAIETSLFSQHLGPIAIDRSIEDTLTFNSWNESETRRQKTRY